MSWTLEKEVYRAKIFDSLCSFCLVLWARPLYSLEYKDSLHKGEVYVAKIAHMFIKVKIILHKNHQNSQKKKNHFFVNVFTLF